MVIKHELVMHRECLSGGHMDGDNYSHPVFALPKYTLVLKCDYRVVELHVPEDQVNDVAALLGLDYRL